MECAEMQRVFLTSAAHIMKKLRLLVAPRAARFKPLFGGSLSLAS
jgi:hypothetical protein